MSGYQSKTTVVTIEVGKWTKETDCSLSSRFSAAHAIAVQIATLCQIDIMSLTPHSLEDAGYDCCLSVAYVNNGRSLEDIRAIMKPVINDKSQSYWMMLDLYEWQGFLDCVATVRGTGEEWG
jgi:hypothetical protein